MNICRDCNQDHSNQIADFPIGATVVVTGDFIGSINAEEYDYRVHTAETAPRVMITKGGYGQVIYHCEDGRAVFEFEAEKGKSKAGHTFHYPETCLRVTVREVETVDLTQVRETLKKLDQVLRNNRATILYLNGIDKRSLDEVPGWIPSNLSFAKDKLERAEKELLEAMEGLRDYLESNED